jgi:hypothetical protein
LHARLLADAHHFLPSFAASGSEVRQLATRRYSRRASPEPSPKDPIHFWQCRRMRRSASARERRRGSLRQGDSLGQGDSLRQGARGGGRGGCVGADAL